jgi:myosin-3
MSYKGLSQHIDFTSLPNPEERFELLHVIGEGTYGKVFYAKGKIFFQFLAHLRCAARREI